MFSIFYVMYKTNL